MSVFRIVEWSAQNLSSFGSVDLGKVAAAIAVGQAGAVHLQRTSSQVAPHTRTLTEALFALNILGALWTTGHLLKTLQEKTKIDFFDPKRGSLQWSYKKIVSVNGVGIVGGAVLARQWIKILGSPPIEEGCWRAPDIYQYSQILYLIQALCHATLFFLGKNSIENALSVAGHALSFSSSRKMGWIQIHGEDGEYFELLLLPSHEKDRPWKVCSGGHVGDKTLTQIFYRLFDEKGIINLFPRCSHSSCKSPFFFARYKDKKGNVSGHSSESFFLLYLGHGLLQAGLSYLQVRNPQQAIPIYKIQMLMLGGDGFRCFSTGKLSQLGYFSLVGTSLLTFLYLFVYEKDMPTLKSASFKEMTLKPLAPLYRKLMMWALVTKSVLDINEALTSKHKVYYFALALLSAITLFYIFKLKWMKLEGTLSGKTFLIECLNGEPHIQQIYDYATKVIEEGTFHHISMPYINSIKEI